MTTAATISERNTPSHQRLPVLTTHHPLYGTATGRGQQALSHGESGRNRVVTWARRDAGGRAASALVPRVSVRGPDAPDRITTPVYWSILPLRSCRCWGRRDEGPFYALGLAASTFPLTDTKKPCAGFALLAASTIVGHHRTSLRQSNAR